MSAFWCSAFDRGAIRSPTRAAEKREVANQIGHGSGAGRTAGGGAGRVRAREPISITQAEYVDLPTCKNCSSSGLVGASANVQYASACSSTTVPMFPRPFSGVVASSTRAGRQPRPRPDRYSLVSSAFAALSPLDLLGAAPLLMLTFSLNTGWAIAYPAWNAEVSSVLPQDMIKDGAALNSLSFNLARTLGPATGWLPVRRGRRRAGLPGQRTVVHRIRALLPRPSTRENHRRRVLGAGETPAERRSRLR